MDKLQSLIQTLTQRAHSDMEELSMTEEELLWMQMEWFMYPVLSEAQQSILAISL